MRKQSLATYLGRALIVGLVFTTVPLLKAPANDANHDLWALATPNRSLKPKPLKVWYVLSTWYGEPFDGQPTANGETYDMYDLTAAHPSLPLGSVVRVVNPRTRRSQVVRINDRGPYVEGRELDVSYEVARRLGFAQRGLARVRLELLEVPKRPAVPRHSD